MPEKTRQRHAQQPQSTKEKKFTDPVSGKEVSSDSPYRVGHMGQTYYFSSEEDKKKFLEKPGFYIRKKEDSEE